MALSPQTTCVHMGMRFLARGGVCIAGGGIIAKMHDRICDGRVLKAYLDQGAATEVIEGIPLYVSNATDLGMMGVLSHAHSVAASQISGYATSLIKKVI